MAAANRPLHHGKPRPAEFRRNPVGDRSVGGFSLGPFTVSK